MADVKSELPTRFYFRHVGNITVYYDSLYQNFSLFIEYLEEVTSLYCRPQSEELGSDDNMPAAPVFLVNSFHKDQLIKPVTSPNTMNPAANCEHKNSSRPSVIFCQLLSTRILMIHNQLINSHVTYSSNWDKMRLTPCNIFAFFQIAGCAHACV